MKCQPISLLRMYWWVTAIFGHNWLLSLLFENCKLNCYQNRYSTTLLFLKFKLEYLLWIGPFHQYPAAYRTATVMPNRSLLGIPISTSLILNQWQKKVLDLLQNRNKLLRTWINPRFCLVNIWIITTIWFWSEEIKTTNPLKQTIMAYMSTMGAKTAFPNFTPPRKVWLYRSFFLIIHV